MTTLNLLWPAWARVVLPLTWQTIVGRGSRCWKTTQKAGALLANRYGREQDARFARLAWEEKLLERQAKATAWTRPPHRAGWPGWLVQRGRHRIRHLALALAFAFMWSDFGAPIAAADDQVEDGEREEKKESRLFRALGFATFAVYAGDAGSTELALANGAVELNPLQENRAARLGAHIAAPWAANHLTSELYKGGHEKQALWIRIGLVAAYGYVTVHNLREAAR